MVGGMEVMEEVVVIVLGSVEMPVVLDRVHVARSLQAHTGSMI